MCIYFLNYLATESKSINKIKGMEDVFYYMLLCLHSWLRWAVLGSLLFAVYIGVRGAQKKMRFSDTHKNIRLAALVACFAQFFLGLWLYSGSPITEMFWANTKEAIADKVMRFWSIEHVAIIVLALAVISFGYYKSHQTKSERKKFTLMAMYYGIGLLIILAAIPWLASNGLGRPWFRIP